MGIQENNKRLYKYTFLNTLLMVIAFAATALAIVTGSYVNDKENIQVGSVSPSRFVAPRDMVDETATEKLKVAARNSVGVLYKHDTEIQEKTIADIEEFFQGVEEVLTAYEETGSFDKETTLKIPVAFSEKQYKTYDELTYNGRQEFQTDVIGIVNSVFDQGITEDTKEKSLDLVRDLLKQTVWNSELQNMAYSIAAAAVEPNLVLDDDAILAAQEQKAAEVQNVMIKKNQKIVDEGEVITQSVYRLLVEMNLINQNVSDNMVPVVGSLCIVVLLFVATYIYFKNQNVRLVKKRNEMLILFTVYLLTIIILRVTAKISLFAIIPVSIFAMLVSILISTRVAVILNLFVCIVGTFIASGDLEFLLYFAVTGTISALLVQYTEKRRHILMVSIGIGISNVLCMIGIGLFVENGYSTALLYNALYAGITGILTVIICIGSLPFWEGVFEVNSSVRLLELTNPDNELLRRLMIEAPGTYHHSLIVANLAETAAFDVFANPTLARVCAYYHDIGKLKYPLYFAENQGGENPHDNMDPYDSAKIIIEHVRYGHELAEKHNLPKAVKDIITEHHGTTLVKFFYYKASKQNTDEPVDEAEFRYPGPIPQGKESAIIMLADTVEAAVRSKISNGKDLSQVEEFIRTLIKDKLDDGQLNDSDLKIKDLDTIRQSFIKVFHGMYHDRISYPKQEELDKLKNKNKESGDDTTNR